MRPPNRILRQFTALVSGQVIGSGLGMVFWIVAAREVSAPRLGVAAAAINTQTLLGTFSLLGLGTFLLRQMPGLAAERQRHVVRAAMLCVAVFGLLVGGVACALAPLWGHTLRTALEDPAVVPFFVVGVAVYAMSIVLDQAALGAQRARLQVVRNAVAAGLRFPVALALIALGVRTSWVLVAAWVLPLLLSLAVLWRALRLPRSTPSVGERARSLVAAHWREALHDHGLNLAMGAGPLLVPVVAAVRLGAIDTAHFSVAWLLATFVFIPPYLLATSLFAATVGGGIEDFSRSARQTLPAALSLSAALCVGAWLLGPFALRLLGHQYAAGSAHLLDVLVIGGLCMVVKDHLVARARVLGRQTVAMRFVAFAVVLEFFGAFFGAKWWGPTGLCVGWLGIQGAEVFVTAPLTVRMLRAVPWRATLDPDREMIRKREDGVMSQSKKETAGNRTVLVFAAFLLVAGVIAGIMGIKSGGGRSPLESDAAPISCIETPAHPGPLLDLGIQPAGKGSVPPMTKGTIEHLVALAKSAGATVISTTANWRAEQPANNGRYQWTLMDEVIDAARAAGLQVRLEVQGMPRWAVDTQEAPYAQWRPPLTSGELAHWSSFITALSQHVAGRVKYLEVWTEPDQKKTWSSGPDPTAFVHLLHATYGAAKAADPAITVISGGLSNNDLGFLAQVYTARNAVYGSKTPLFDMVGLHPYSGNRSPQTNSTDYAYDRAPFGEYDQNFLGFRRVHAEMAANGDGAKSIYLGEFGYSTSSTGSVDGISDATRAKYAGEALSAATCYPYVKALSWYYLYPTPWNPASWAIVGKGFTLSKTYEALVTWTHSRAAHAGG